MRDLSSIPVQVLRELEDLETCSLKRVINATGVVLHTISAVRRWRGSDRARAIRISSTASSSETVASATSHLGPLLERVIGIPASW